DEPERALEIMRAHPFAVLISSGARGLTATHLPLLVRDAGHIAGHMARANPHWRELEGKEVLVVFNGAHAYVSPRYYAHPEDNVPTWSYAAVHAYGRARLIDGPARLRELLEETVRAFETPLEAPWHIEEAGAKVDRLIGGIVGFEVLVERL